MEFAIFNALNVKKVVVTVLNVCKDNFEMYSLHANVKKGTMMMKVWKCIAKNAIPLVKLVLASRNVFLVELKIIGFWICLRVLVVVKLGTKKASLEKNVWNVIPIMANAY